MNILKSTVASPRKQFRDPKTGTKFDLAYITPNIIVTSMPVDDYLHWAYRTNVKDLRAFLDDRHKDHWQIWNFRAETSGSYKDEVFYGRVVRFPFPDHAPPPFDLIPKVIASLNNFLNQDSKNVAVLHCKAGQGRSGSMACAYLIAEKSYSWQQAIDKFTSRRMRTGFGPGVSIASQRRYLQYTQQWTRAGKVYSFLEKNIEIDSITLYNVKYPDIVVKIGDYSSGAAEIQQQHRFSPYEQDEISRKKGGSTMRYSFKNITYRLNPDVRVSFTRSKLLFTGVNIVHSLAHCYINAFFETFRENNSELHLEEHDSSDSIYGAVTLGWEDLDGVIGTSGRGTKSFDKVEIRWHFINSNLLENDSILKSQVPSQVPAPVKNANKIQDSADQTFAEPSSAPPLPDRPKA